MAPDTDIKNSNETINNDTSNTDSNTPTSCDPIKNKQFTKLKELLHEYPANTFDDNGHKIFTHTSIKYPAGSYNIPQEEMETVYQLLEKDLATGAKVHLTEKPTNPSVLKVDLDFRFDLEESSRKYTTNHIQEIVKAYNQTILEYVDIDPKEVNAYVFERTKPYPFKGNYKDGIHIMYPDVMIDTALQMVIRDRILEKCHDIFGDLPLKNTYADVVDLAVIARNNWLMYGCCKPGLDPYDLIHVYTHDLQEESNLKQEKYNTGSLIRNLSNFNKKKPISYVKDDPEKQATYEHKKNQQNEKEKKKANRKDLNRNIILKQRRYRPKCPDGVLLEVKKLVQILHDYRAQNWLNWIEVGWCLHNIDDSLLDTWIEFSKRWDEYTDSTECEQEWAKARDDGLGLGTLHRWARLDNPEEYAKIQRDNISTYILKSITCTTYDVARVVYELYKYQYKCVDVKHNIWYEFRGHRWHEMDSAIGLRKKISNDVLNEYLHLVSYYNGNAISRMDDDKDQFLVKCKALTDVTYKLRDYTFKDKILKECITFFHDETFFQKIRR